MTFCARRPTARRVTQSIWAPYSVGRKASKCFCARPQAGAGANCPTLRDFNRRHAVNSSDAVSSIGPGQSVTVVTAYTDKALALSLIDARETLDGLDLASRGAALEDLYNTILGHVYPAYTRRRPRARIVRLLAAMFPDAMTCLMDERRVWAGQRAMGALRLPGGLCRAASRDTRRDKTCLGRSGKASAVPAFSLLPASSAGNIISQALVATQSQCQKQGLDKARNGPDLAGLIRKRYLDLINIAPAPTFGRVISLDDRMARTLEMRAGMTIWRLVAATDMAAFAT